MKAIYLIAAIALMLVPCASASFSISPSTKGWSIQDITNDEYTIHVVNTGESSTAQIEPLVQTFVYYENYTLFHPVPPEFMQYVTVTPSEMNLGKGESDDFTVHVSFPDLDEMYGHTWEYRILFNDTNKYTFENGGVEKTQRLHVVQMYFPQVRPVKPVETPFYVYPFIIIFSLVVLGGLIIYLRKRSVPLAMRDHGTSVSEWAGMDVGSHPNEPAAPPERKKNLFRRMPAADGEAVVTLPIPKGIRDFIEDPTLPDLPQRKPVVIRSPAPLKPVTINGGKAKARTPVKIKE